MGLLVIMILCVCLVFFVVKYIRTKKKLDFNVKEVNNPDDTEMKDVKVYGRMTNN